MRCPTPHPRPLSAIPLPGFGSSFSSPDSLIHTWECWFSLSWSSCLSERTGGSLKTQGKIVTAAGMTGTLPNLQVMEKSSRGLPRVVIQHSHRRGALNGASEHSLGLEPADQAACPWVWLMLSPKEQLRTLNTFLLQHIWPPALKASNSLL